MNIVLVGDANDIWLKKYISYVLIGQNHNLTLCTITNNVYQDFYRENNITVIEIAPKGLVYKIPKVRFYASNLKVKNIVKNIKDIDVLHVLWIDKVNLLFYKELSKKARYGIFTYYGSDLLRMSLKTLKAYEPIMDKVDSFTVMIKSMQRKFLEVYGQQYAKRCIVLDFGNSNYKLIKEILAKESKSFCKKHFHMNEDKISIAIGYAGTPVHQHGKVIQELENLSSEIKSQIQIILHMPVSANNSEYIREISEQMDKINCDYVILKEFLPDNEIALLRCAIDIFVHSQVSDALSGTLLEYLYAGALLINPAWIQYDELKERGIKYVEYAEFPELTGIISEIVRNKQTYFDKYTSDKKELEDMNSWEMVSAKWRKLYERK